MTPNSGRLVAWRSAEQLLGASGEFDPAPPSAMSTFVHFEKPCRCKICSGENPPTRLQRRRRRGEKTKPNDAISPPSRTARISSAIPDAVLAPLRPKLIRAARRQLFQRGLDQQHAEDLVQDALVRWCASHAEYHGLSPAAGYLHSTIKRLASDMDRRRHDLLDGPCSSLDEPPLNGEALRAAGALTWSTTGRR